MSEVETVAASTAAPTTTIAPATAQDTAPPEPQIETIKSEAPQPQPKPNGNGQARDPAEWIDMDALPPEYRKIVEPRLNRLYSFAKQAETDIDVLRRHAMQLQGQLREVTDKQLREQRQDEESRLTSELTRAHQEADFNRVSQLTAQIAELKAKPAPMPAPPPQQHAAPVQQLPPQVTETIARWSQESAEDGLPARPFTRPGHPDFEPAAGMINSLLASPSWRAKGLPAILAEMDRMFGGPAPRKAPPAAPPTTSNARPQGNGKQPTLTPDEYRVARLMNLKPDDYLKQKIELEKLRR